MARLPGARRGAERVLRNDRDGVTWKVVPAGGTLHIEIVFDDDPEDVISKKVTPSGPSREALDRMVAEQVAEGFVVQPPWTPSAAWIREADDHELGAEVNDPWMLALDADPSLFPRMPSSVKSFLAVDRVLHVCRRSGLSSFLTEHDPQLVHHLPAAAREMGREDLAELWIAATHGMDLAALERQHSRMPRFTSAKAAKKIEALALDTDYWPMLSAWMREHAEDFASLPALTA